MTRDTCCIVVFVNYMHSMHVFLNNMHIPLTVKMVSLRPTFQPERKNTHNEKNIDNFRRDYGNRFE